MSELPKGWVETTLGEVLPLSYGKAVPETLRANDGHVPVYGSSGIFGCCGGALVSSPCLVVGRKGNVGAAHLTAGPSWVVDTAYFTSGNGAIELSFALYLLESLRLSKLDNSTAIPSLCRDIYNQVSVKIPGIPEQQRIVEQLDFLFSDLGAGIAALNRLKGKLRRYRASVLKAACEGRLVPTEAELARKEGRPYESGEELLKRILVERRAKWEADQLAKMIAAGKPPRDEDWKNKYKEPDPPDRSLLPDLPEGWAWARAEQVCGFITKGTTPSAAKLHDGEGDVPFIKVYNLTDRGVLDFSVNPTFIDRSTHEIELTRSLVLPGDVLMNIVGPPLGKVSLVPVTYAEWNINQAIAVFRARPGLDRRYLMYLLLCDDILRRAVLAAKATAGQFNLTLEICRDLPLPIAPSAEQDRIAAELDARVSSIEATASTGSATLSRADRLRQSILKRAFEGKLVPQDPNDEPASVLLQRIRTEHPHDQSKPTKEKRTKVTHA